MNLFGTDFDAAGVAALVGLTATLVLWLFALSNERRSIRWFRDWEAARKARRDAEIARETGSDAGPSGAGGSKRGPWG